MFEGEIVSENRNGIKRDYVRDPLGSTVALLDSNQTKIDTFGYWPYGEESSRTGSTPIRFRFGGRSVTPRGPAVFGTSVCARSRLRPVGG